MDIELNLRELSIDELNAAIRAITSKIGELKKAVRSANREIASLGESKPERVKELKALIERAQEEQEKYSKRQKELIRETQARQGAFAEQQAHQVEESAKRQIQAAEEIKKKEHQAAQARIAGISTLEEATGRLAELQRQIEAAQPAQAPAYFEQMRDIARRANEEVERLNQALSEVGATSEEEMGRMAARSQELAQIMAAAIEMMRETKRYLPKGYVTGIEGEEISLTTPKQRRRRAQPAPTAQEAEKAKEAAEEIAKATEEAAEASRKAEEASKRASRARKEEAAETAKAAEQQEQATKRSRRSSAAQKQAAEQAQEAAKAQRESAAAAQEAAGAQEQVEKKTTRAARATRKSADEAQKAAKQQKEVGQAAEEAASSTEEAVAATAETTKDYETIIKRLRDEIAVLEDNPLIAAEDDFRRLKAVVEEADQALKELAERPLPDEADNEAYINFFEAAKERAAELYAQVETLADRISLLSKRVAGGQALDAVIGPEAYESARRYSSEISKIVAGFSQLGAELRNRTEEQSAELEAYRHSLSRMVTDIRQKLVDLISARELPFADRETLKEIDKEIKAITDQVVALRTAAAGVFDDEELAELFTRSQQASEGIETLSTRTEDLAGKSLVELEAMVAQVSAQIKALTAHQATLAAQMMQFGKSSQVYKTLDDELRATTQQLIQLKTQQQELNAALGSAYQRGGTVSAYTLLRGRELVEARALAYGYGRVGMSLRAVGRGMARFGLPLEEAAYISGDVFRAIRGLQILATESKALGKLAIKSSGGLGKLALGIGATAAVTIALVGATQLLKKAHEGAVKATENLVRGIEAYYNIVTTSTTVEAELQREEIERRLQINKQRREEIEALKGIFHAEGAVNVLSDISASLGYLVSRALISGERVEEVADRLGVSVDYLLNLDYKTLENAGKELNQTIRQDEIALQMLNNALRDNVMAANDAREALKKLAQQQAELSFQRVSLAIDHLREALEGTVSPAEIEGRISLWYAELAMVNQLYSEFMKKATEVTEEAVDEATGIFLKQFYLEQASEAKAQGERLKLAIDVATAWLPTYQRTYAAAQRSAQAVEELNRKYALQEEIIQRIRTEQDPAAILQELDTTRQLIDLTANRMADLRRQHEAGIITAQDYEQAQSELNEQMAEYAGRAVMLENVILPAARKNQKLAEAIEQLGNKSAEAEEQVRLLIESQTQAYLSGADRRIRAALQAIEPEDPQQLRTRMRQLRRETSTYTDELLELSRQFMAGKVSAEVFRAANEDLQRRLRETGNELQELSYVLPLATRFSGFREIGERMQRYIEWQKEQAEIDEQRRREEILELEEFTRARQKEIAEFYEQLGEMDNEYRVRILEEQGRYKEELSKQEKDRLKLEQQYNEDMQKLAEDHRKRMLEIYRELSQGIESAVEERSVSAAIEAIRASKERQREEQERYAEEKRERWEDFQDRLKEMAAERREREREYQKRLIELRQQHQKEREERIRDFWRRLADEDREREWRRQRQIQEWAYEDEKRRRHFFEVQSSYATFFANVYGITVTNLENLKLAFSSFFRGLSAEASQATAQTKSKTEIRLPFGLKLPSFQYGGTVVPGQLVKVGEAGLEYARFWPDGRWQIIPGSRGRRLPTVTAAGAQVSVNMPVSVSVQSGDPAVIERAFETRILPRLTTAIRNATAVRY